MKQIVFAFLIYIQIQWQIINYLLVLLMGKNFTPKPVDTPINKLYQQMQVDCFPLIETLELLYYRQLLAEYKRKHSKPLKPVKRHKNSKAISLILEPFLVFFDFCLDSFNQFWTNFFRKLIIDRLNCFLEFCPLFWG